MTAKKIYYLSLIDRWIGRWFCFLLTIIYRFSNFFQKNEKKQVKNILIIQLSEMGSIILAYPALVKLTQMYNDANIFLLTFHQQRPLIKILPFDNKKISVLSISINSLMIFCYSFLITIYHIWKKSFDIVIDFERFSRFSAVITGLSFAPVRAGFSRYSDEGLYRGNFLTHAVWYNNYMHISSNFLSMIKALEFTPMTQPLPRLPYDIIENIPVYPVSKTKIVNIRQKVIDHCPKASEYRLWVVFNVSQGNPLPIRSWPLNYYELLGKKILMNHRAVIILCGQQDARQNGDYLSKKLGQKFCWDATDQLDIDELMYLFGCCHILITSDSGMAHLASMTDIPSIVIFGPETPLRYSPLGKNHTNLFANFSCSPCFSPHNHCLSTCNDAKCLKAITPENVYTEMQRILNNFQYCH